MSFRPPPIDQKFRGHHHLLGKFYVESYDREGELLGHAESQENDLLLNNLGFFLTNIFPGATSTGLGFSTVTARGGAAFTIVTYTAGVATSSSQYFGDLSIGTSIGSYVGVGTSNTAPARGDTDLTALASLAPALSGGYSTTSFIVTVAGGVIISNALTVTEAGVYLRVHGPILATSSIFLLAHDLVSPGLAVPSGGLASVNWALQI